MEQVVTPPLDEPGVLPGDQEFEYKGHPQPSVNERLEESRNFLADEDPNRCLQFDTKISQIENFVAHIEKEGLPHDEILLKHVKTMLKTHRHWEPSLEGPQLPETDCCDAPRLRSFSTRLMNYEIAEAYKEGQEEMGLGTQMREDHPPFTVDRQEDQVEFLKELQKDAGTDPDLLDPSTNLYWKEVEAYDWALKEPASIPYWMHPTKGIPKTSKRDTDKSWYDADTLIPSPVNRRRPARGWVPSYLLDVETKINSLLKEGWTSTDENYDKLIQLLRFVEPQNVRQLRERWEGFQSAETLTSLGPDQRKSKEASKTEYWDAENAWLRSFHDIGVYFIVNQNEKMKVNQPGTFYVSDGIMSDEQRNTLAVANRLLRSMLAEGGRENMTNEDNILLDGFLRYSLPQDVQDLEDERLAILERAGANSFNDLSDEDQNTFKAFELRARQEQDKWEAHFKEQAWNTAPIKPNERPEFRYLRPGEIKDEGGSILYLPWHFKSVPQFHPAKRRELELPQEVVQLEEEINARLRRDTLADLDDESEAERKHVSRLLHVVYPELASILGPFFQLGKKKRNEELNEDEASWLAILEPAAKNAWESWYNGLGDHLTIKMAQPAQQPENPSILYRRTQASEDEERAAVITRELASGEDSPEFFSRIFDLLVDYQYPALRRLYDEFFKKAGQSTPQRPTRVQKDRLLKKEWGTKFRKWVDSKRGRTVSIKSPNPYIDPDDDPSVVYFRHFRDAFPSTDTYPPLTPDMKNHFESRRSMGLPQYNQIDPTMWTQLPQPIKDALLRCYETGSSVHRVVLDWHLDQWFAGPEQFPKPPTPGSASTILSSSESIFTDISAALTFSSIAPPTKPDSPIQGQRQAHDSRTRVDPQLGVDLSRLTREIVAIEEESNRILSNLSTTQDKTVIWDMGDYLRLVELLKQFTPDSIHQRKKLAMSIAEEISTPAANKPPLWKQKDLHEQSLQYEEDFRNWIFSLLKLRLVVKVSEATPQLTRQRLLEFNPDVTGTAGSFTIRVPDTRAGVTIDQAPIVDVKLPPPTPISPLTMGLYSDHRESIKASQKTINSLLAKYSQEGGLDWHDSELLLRHLRRVMPINLQKLDSDLRAIDDKARDPTRQLSDDEKLEFGDLWYNWNQEYYRWLKSLSATGIKIARKVGPNDNESTLELMVERWDEAIPPRSHNLPSPVFEIFEALKSLISGKYPLDWETIAQLDVLLRPHHRPVATIIREKLNDLLKKPISCSNDADQHEAEDIILVEAGLTLEFLLWIKELQNTPNATFEMEELVPSRFSLQLIVDGVRESKDKRAIESKAEKAWERLCPDFLVASKKQFHEAVIKIRTGGAINPRDLQIVRKMIQPFSQESYVEILDTIFRLTTKNQETELSSREQAELARADTVWLWYHLGRRFPDSRKLVGVEPVAGSFEHLFLNGTRLAGDGLPPDPPAPVPPNKYETREVEIELNNLLHKYFVGEITSTEKKEFEYLLMALLPSDVQEIKNRIDRLEKQHLTLPGIELRDGISLIEARNIFYRYFEEFISSFNPTAFPIFLDTYWYTPESIARVVQLAKTWKEEVKGPGDSESFPSTGHRIQNAELKLVHSQYSLLKRFVEKGCEADVEIEQLLLISDLPEELQHLRQQIIDHEGNDVELTDDSQATELGIQFQVLQNQFVHLYMKHYLSLPPKDRQALNAKAAVRDAGNVDYIGMAERRGIRRAAIELALNLLATNQEQHRPHDRFREVDISGQRYVPPEPEVPLTLPLAPSRRPLEQDPFEYTKKMHAYREWKDFDFEIARKRTEGKREDLFPPPNNFNGPIVAADAADFEAAAARRANELLHISGLLAKAEARYPRPLLQEMLLRFHEGLTNIEKDGVPRNRWYDEEPLTTEDIYLLLELAKPSWDELALPFPEPAPGDDQAERDLDELQEFEMTLQQTFRFGKFASGPREHGQLPFWTPYQGTQHLEGLEPDDEMRYWQVDYDQNFPSRNGLSVPRVQKALGDFMVPNDAVPWSEEEVRNLLRGLARLKRIHFDEEMDRASLIPYSGHPENKYVISRDPVELTLSAGVKRISEGEFEVQYDAAGTKGRPVLQVNKYYHLQRLAFRLGLNAQFFLQNSEEKQDRTDYAAYQTEEYDVIAGEMPYITPADRIAEGGTATKTNPQKINLPRIARNLLQVAPELLADSFPEYDPEMLTDAGLEKLADDEETLIELKQEQEYVASTIIQNQILEEISNNWERKFPENEHVWDFAAPRIEVQTKEVNGRKVASRPRLTQFFHMRRFPVNCQKKETREIIKSSGPVVQEKPKLVEREEEISEDEAWRRREERKRKKYFEGIPYFPFGETAYQAAYQSHRMEQDLADVPEFQPKKPIPPSLLSRLTRLFNRSQRSPSPSPPSSLNLPSLPKNFPTSNIPLPAKAYQISKLVRKLPSFPDENILEYYHTPDEIRYLKAVERGREEDRRVEEYLRKNLGKGIAEATFDEVEDARGELGLDAWEDYGTRLRGRVDFGMGDERRRLSGAVRPVLPVRLVQTGERRKRDESDDGGNETPSPSNKKKIRQEEKRRKREREVQEVHVEERRESKRRRQATVVDESEEEEEELDEKGLRERFGNLVSGVRDSEGRVGGVV